MQFWSGDHLAIEVSGPAGASEIVVRHPYALIGAIARADVRLSGDGVQKREALLYAIDGKIMCRRLEAALPEAYCEIPQGAPFALGKHRLRVRVLRNENESPALDLDAKPRIPVLRVRHKARASVNRRLYKPIETVGRAGDCEFELPGLQASLYHCVLLREASRLWCIDLGSGNGTLLNGRRIECALIEIGSKLRVGDFELEFQRYSRRSSAPPSGDNASASNLSLSPPLPGNPLAELASREDVIDILAGESIYGSEIADNAATLHGSPSSPSALPGLLAPPAEDLRSLQDKQAEMLAAQAELLSRFEALSTETNQLRADQETLSRQLSQRMAEQRATLLHELQQQSQAHAGSLIGDLQQRLDDTISDRTELLDRQWDARQSESHQSVARQQAAQTESLRQALSQELSSRLEQWSQSHADGLAKQAESLQEKITQELQKRLETLATPQAEQLLAETRRQADAIARQFAERLDDLAASQWQQLKLQNEAQRHVLMQELTRRMDAALEGHSRPAAAPDEDVSQVLSQQWLQRLDDLRRAQSDEIVAAVGAQGQVLSQQLTVRLNNLQRALLQDLGRQSDEQRQSLLQECSRQLDDKIAAWQQAQLHHEITAQPARLVAAELEELRQTLSQELSRQAEARQAAFSQEFLGKLETQRSAVAVRQQAQADNLKQQIAGLQATVNQMLAQQSELSGRISAQADELMTIRSEQRELQSSAPETLVDRTPEAQSDWQPIEPADSREDNYEVSLDHGILAAADAVEPESTEPSQTTAISELTLSRRAPLRQPTAIDADDPLLHFVSDRLAQLDTGRQRRVVVYWAVGIATAVLLIIVAWALFAWLPGYWPQG